MMRGKKQKALLRKIANTEAEHKSVPMIIINTWNINFIGFLKQIKGH